MANAGDSRGVISFKGKPLPMSFDFTPETETQRIRKLVRIFVLLYAFLICIVSLSSGIRKRSFIFS